MEEGGLATTTYCIQNKVGNINLREEQIKRKESGSNGKGGRLGGILLSRCFIHSTKQSYFLDGYVVNHTYSVVP